MQGSREPGRPIGEMLAIAKARGQKLVEERAARRQRRLPLVARVVSLAALALLAGLVVFAGVQPGRSGVSTGAGVPSSGTGPTIPPGPHRGGPGGGKAGPTTTAGPAPSPSTPATTTTVPVPAGNGGGRPGGTVPATTAPDAYPLGDVLPEPHGCAVDLTVTTDRQSYAPGVTAAATVAERNASQQACNEYFSSSVPFVVAEDSSGTPVWNSCSLAAPLGDPASCAASSAVTGSLAPGASASEQVSWQVPASAGTYWLAVIAGGEPATSTRVEVGSGSGGFTLPNATPYCGFGMAATTPQGAYSPGSEVPVTLAVTDTSPVVCPPPAAGGIAVSITDPQGATVWSGQCSAGGSGCGSYAEHAYLLPGASESFAVGTWDGQAPSPQGGTEPAPPGAYAIMVGSQKVGSVDIT